MTTEATYSRLSDEISAYSCHLHHTFNGEVIQDGPFPLEGLMGDCSLSDYREYMEVEHGYTLAYITPKPSANLLATWVKGGRKYTIAFA